MQVSYAPGRRIEDLTHLTARTLRHIKIAFLSIPATVSSADVDRRTPQQLEQTAQSFVEAYRKRRDFADVKC